jgi:uncharacterized protein (DUF1919 family)
MITSARMSRVVVFDEQKFYSDFIEYYDDNNEMYDISNVFDWYFEQHIYTTEKYNQWFKHFFPTHPEIDEELLHDKLFEIIQDHIEGDIRSGDDTDEE